MSDIPAGSTLLFIKNTFDSLPVAAIKISAFLILKSFLGGIFHLTTCAPGLTQSSGSCVNSLKAHKFRVRMQLLKRGHVVQTA